MPLAVQVESLLNGLRDNSGEPLAGGKVYSYTAGTLTAKTLYTTVDKSASATNPLILDSVGRAHVYADGTYKFVIKDADGTTIQTLDNLRYGYDDGELLAGGSAGGTGNAQTITAGTISAYADGQLFTYKATATNSGATTLNVNDIGVKSIVKGVTPSALSGGEIQSGQVVQVVYDSASSGRFRLLGGNFDTAVSRTQHPTVAQVQDSLLTYVSSGGSSSAYTLTLAPAITAYVAGQRFTFLANHSNDGASSLNVNGLGAKSIRHYTGSLACYGGEIVSGAICDVVYDGTQFILMRHAGGFNEWTPTYTGGGTLAFGSVTESLNKFQVKDGFCEIHLVASGTVSGSSDVIRVTLPVNATETLGPMAAACYEGSTWIPVFAEVDINSAVYIIKPAGTAYVAGAVRIHIAGRYPVI